MNTRHWLIAILVLAAVLRLVGLERGDPLDDEVTYAFRAIGLVDSFNDPRIQSTPWEWFSPDIPGWAKISFHDHPPLVFWIQHLAMNVFGESIWAARLPSVIFGIGSIFILFLIARRLYGERVALLASAFMAVTLNPVFISRVGQQEASVIFFLLLTLYLLLLAIERERHLISVGIAVGLGLLSKYTLLILIPIVITYLAITKREYFRRKLFWIAALLACIIASPILIYNLGLARATGHFDFQFSYLFGQHPAVWPKAPGKDIGSLAERISALVPRLIASHSWLFLAIAAASMLGWLAAAFRRWGQALRPHALLVIAVGWWLLLLLAIGTAVRFLTPLTPFLAVAAAFGLDAANARFLKKTRPRIGYLLLGLLLTFEVFYSINNQIAYYPRGPRPWASSLLRFENYNWGYNALDDYLTQELKGKIPALTFETTFSFVRDIQNADIARGRRRGDDPYPALIITYGDFDLMPEIWVFDRRLLYHGWPVLTLDQYLAARDEAGEDPFRTAGIRTRYIIAPSTIAIPERLGAIVGSTEPTHIVRPDGIEAFRAWRIAK